MLIFFGKAFSDNSSDVFAKFKSNAEECFKEIHVSKEMVETFFKDGVFTDDKNLKCFINCLQLKLKVINEDGVANVDEMKKVLLPLAQDKAKDLYHVNPDFANKIESYATECMENSGVNSNLIRSLLNGEFNEDRGLKCFVKCIFQRAEAMTDDGHLIESGVKQLMPSDVDKHKINIIFQKCRPFQVSDLCYTAFSVAKCIFEYVQ
ncbi:hypothetical protein RN001_002118 [Aquatica leii]|uniref:Uncharacterized protein n=1 Tax=Aquatica leii TaxID=1421715 RepID=A0AAN7Q8D5_9COLE|nr:hypothetical protein RN001_002118 [Aquatica leii]